MSTNIKSYKVFENFRNFDEDLCFFDYARSHVSSVFRKNRSMRWQDFDFFTKKSKFYRLSDQVFVKKLRNEVCFCVVVRSERWFFFKKPTFDHQTTCWTSPISSNFSKIWLSLTSVRVGKGVLWRCRTPISCSFAFKWRWRKGSEKQNFEKNRNSASTDPSRLTFTRPSTHSQDLLEAGFWKKPDFQMVLMGRDFTNSDPTSGFALGFVDSGGNYQLPTSQDLPEGGSRGVREGCFWPEFRPVSRSFKKVEGTFGVSERGLKKPLRTPQNYPQKPPFFEGFFDHFFLPFFIFWSRFRVFPKVQRTSKNSFRICKFGCLQIAPCFPDFSSQNG